MRPSRRYPLASNRTRRARITAPRRPRPRAALAKNVDTHEWRVDKDPKGVQQISPGRKPWGSGFRIAESPEGATQADCSALSGLCLFVPLVPRACALGFPESPLSGLRAVFLRHNTEDGQRC